MKALALMTKGEIMDYLRNYASVQLCQREMGVGWGDMTSISQKASINGK